MNFIHNQSTPIKSHRAKTINCILAIGAADLQSAGQEILDTAPQNYSILDPMALISASIPASKAFLGGAVLFPLSAILLGCVLKKYMTTKPKVAPNQTGVSSHNTTAEQSTRQPIGQEKKDEALQGPPEGMAARDFEFAAKLYSELAKSSPENLVFSPSCIDAVLGMLYHGSSGDTADQLYEGLCYQSKEQAFHNGSVAQYLKDQLNSSDNDVEYKTGNALYVDKEFKIQADYFKLMKDQFKSEVHQADFKKPNGAIDVMNKWVAAETNGMIKSVFEHDSLSDQTKLVLLNAVYLKAKWKDAFDPAYTKEKEFSAPKGVKKTVKMMNQTEEFKFYHDHKAKCKMVELPYTGNRLSMIVCLPDDEDDLKSIPSALSTFNMDNMKRTDVHVSLPKFKLDVKLDLNSTLESLGMDEMFSGKADFSKIDANNGLYVSQVKHNAVIEVDEAGTEAAAVTSGCLVAKGCFEPPKTFNCDHPFFLMIRDIKTGTNLFMGHVTDPTKGTQL